MTLSVWGRWVIMSVNILLIFSDYKVSHDDVKRLSWVKESDGLGEETPPKSLSFCHQAAEALTRWQLSRILAMNFRPIAIRGHLCTTLTLTPHYCCHSPLNCISHHPLHRHSCSHWSRTHLRTISQSPSPNHTDFISLGLPLG